MSSLVFFFNVYLFWEKESTTAQEGEGQKERERKFQAGSVCSAQSLMWGSKSQTTRRWLEPKSRVGCLTDWATQVPPVTSLNRVKEGVLKKTEPDWCSQCKRNSTSYCWFWRWKKEPLAKEWKWLLEREKVKKWILPQKILPCVSADLLI